MARMNSRTKRIALLLSALLLLSLLIYGCRGDEDFEQTKAYKVTSRSQLIGGPKALGNIGDYILENDKIRVLINGHPTDMSGGGVNKWGGAILDADIQRPEDFFDPSQAGYDKFLEMVSIFDVKILGYDNYLGSGPVYKMPQDSIEVISKGGEDEAAEIRVKGVLQNLISLIRLIPVPLNFLPVRGETVYRLEPGKNYVEITTTFTLLNRDGSEPDEFSEVPLRPVTAEDNSLFAMFNGDAFGDAVFYGDSVSVFGPGVFGFSSEFYNEELYNLGKSQLVDNLVMDWSAGVADEIGYGLVAPDGPLSFPIMESFLTIAIQKVSGSEYIFPQPGSTYTYKRHFIVDEGDVAGILDHVVDLRDWPHGEIQGSVLFENGGSAASDINVLLFPHPRFLKADGTLGDPVPVKSTLEEMNTYLQSLPAAAVNYHRLMPYSRFRTDSRRLDAAKDGSFEGKVPVDADTKTADYILMASGPANTHSDLRPVRIKDGGVKKVTLVLPATGEVNVTVHSLTPKGPAEPCKITFMGTRYEGTADPFIGESFIPAKEAAVVHAFDGKASVTLQPGTYKVYAGRGPEYSVDETEVTVSAYESRSLEMYIDRVVDTSGWVAADLHLHSHISVDSGISLEDRVLAALVHGLDIVSSTDHDAITNYRPTLEDLGGMAMMQVLNGNELSHFSFGHFNAYPLKYDQTKTSGGAPQWRNPSPTATYPDTGEPLPLFTPQDVFDSLRAVGDRDMIDQDPMVVINHTEESFTGYLRAYGFEQYYGTFSSPDFLTIGDPVVNNGKLLAKDGSENFSWDFDGIELLNAKRFSDFRTITEEEIVEGDFGQPRPAEAPLLPCLIRTGDEQVRMLTGELLLDHTNRGMVDDYMTLQAMGHRVAGLGTSDSHDRVKTEVGKCRTYVMSSTDDPAFMDVNEFITNLKAGRAIATTGPFLEAWVDGFPIGSDVYDPDGTIDVRIRAQAPPWMSFDRIEIYGNGILIGEIGADSTDHFLGCDTTGVLIGADDQVVRFNDTVSCSIDADTTIMVIGIGYDGMTPHSNPIDGPAIEIDDTLILGLNVILKEWLGISNLIPLESPLERNHEIYPYVVTNAIFVDTDGVDADGDGQPYDGPGYIPGWFDEEDIDPALKEDPDVQLAVYAAKERILSMTHQMMNPMNSRTLDSDSDDSGSEDDEFGGSCG